MKSVKVLGSGVPYLDGAEHELLTIMQQAQDRSTGSDELAHQIHDWPTEYHLSRARVNILKPFNLPEGTRVLDIGCGTGALVRQFAEWGNEVVGLEGSYERCLVAAERVREFDNVEIVFGSLDEFADEYNGPKFDFIMICGVLEYSGSDIGGESGPLNMLAMAKSLLADEGVVAIAIENKLGVKYISGHNEDHLGKPLVGLQNYLNQKTGIQTWSKLGLSNLIKKAGFNELKFFAPFPDYKTPKIVVSEDLWNEPDGRQIAQNFLRTPIRDKSHQPAFDVDLVTFWQGYLDLTSPLDVANSFLVTVTKTNTHTHPFIKTGLLWIGNEDRLKKFDNSQVLVSKNGVLELQVENNQDIQLSNLTFKRKACSVIVGINLEDFIIESLRNKKGIEAYQVFEPWWNLAKKLVAIDDKLINFDALPRNFIKSGTGDWVFIDYEWYWNKPISLQIIFLRSIYYLFSERILKLQMPFIIEYPTLKDFAIKLAQHLSLELNDKSFLEAAIFTSEVNALVTGKSDGNDVDLFLKQFGILPGAEKFFELQSRSERETLAFEREALIYDRDAIRLRLDNLLNSFSWKITKILRLPKRIFQEISKNAKK